MSALDETYGGKFFTAKRRQSNGPSEDEQHYQDQSQSVDRNEYSAENYKQKQHASTAYGTLVNQNYRSSNNSFISA